MSAVRVVSEADGWSVFIPGLPVAANASSFDEAIAEMVCALQEYAEDWRRRLSDAPNHRDNWGLVQYRPDTLGPIALQPCGSPTSQVRNCSSSLKLTNYSFPRAFNGRRKLAKIVERRARRRLRREL